MDAISGFACWKRRVAPAALLATVLGLAASDAAAQLPAEDLARVAWIEETAVSPDGQWVAYIRSLPAAPGQAARGRTRDLFLIRTAGGEPRLLVSAEHAPGSPSWSPDGARLAFLAEIKSRSIHRQVYALPPGGGEPRALTGTPTGVRAFAFSPEGRSLGFLAAEPVPDSIANRKRQGYDAIVYGEPDPHVRLFVKDLPAGVPRALTPPDRTIWDFAWSPNGKAFAVQVTEGTDGISSRNFRRLYTVPAGGGPLALLARTEGQLGSMAWSPDGVSLAFVGATSLRDSTGQSLFVVPAGGGEAVDLTSGYEGAVLWVGWRDPATLLFGAIEGTRTALNRIGPAGGGFARVVSGEESFVFIQIGVSTGLSLDAGRKMFAAPMNTATDAEELYVGTTDGAQLRRLTNHNGFLERSRLARQETIEWVVADGLRIEGVLIHPLDERAGVRYPLVVILHGGPHAAAVNSFDLTSPQSPGQVYAGRSYAVLYPNFRGSIGRGVAFSRASQGDLGGRDLQDVLAGVDHLIGKGLVDGDRVAIQGHSYGGYLAALAAGLHRDRFKAAIAAAPITDWTSYIGSCREPVHETLALWNVWWYERPGLLSERSPLAHVRRDWTPLHIDHGMLDEEVPFLQSVELYQALRFAGAEVRLVAYPREWHDYVEEAHRIDVIQRYLDWLDRHLGTGPARDGPGG